MLDVEVLIPDHFYFHHNDRKVSAVYSIAEIFCCTENSKSRYLISFVRSVALKTPQSEEFPELHSSINFKESGHFMENNSLI